MACNVLEVDIESKYKSLTCDILCHRLMKLHKKYGYGTENSIESSNAWKNENNYEM
jgi:hypothetical protein